LLEQDAENAWLDLDPAENTDATPDKAGWALDRILAHLRDKEQGTPSLPHLTPPTRAPPKTLPLFAGKEAGSTPLNQHGRH
jgi:hypothetical protein